MFWAVNNHVAHCRLACQTITIVVEVAQQPGITVIMSLPHPEAMRNQVQSGEHSHLSYSCKMSRPTVEPATRPIEPWSSPAFHLIVPPLRAAGQLQPSPAEGSTTILTKNRIRRPVDITSHHRIRCLLEYGACRPKENDEAAYSSLIVK